MKIKKYRIDCACNNCINYKNGYCNIVYDDITIDKNGYCLTKYIHSL